MKIKSVNYNVTLQTYDCHIPATRKKGKQATHRIEIEFEIKFLLLIYAHIQIPCLTFYSFVTKTSCEFSLSSIVSIK